jgi:D-threonate/D-erythronate kinase
VLDCQTQQQEAAIVTEHLAIVADDLTGAIDTAGVFASAGFAAFVSLSTSARPHHSDFDVLCLDSGTRYVPATEAAARVRQETETLLSAGLSRLYKKIDSTLRGNVAAETATILQVSKAPFAFVAPAFPATGRTQRDGVLYVDGTPLINATEGQDKMGRPATSSVVELLQQAPLQCGLVPLTDVESGETAIATRIQTLLADGCSILAVDAVTTEHLRRIDSTMANRFPAALPVGSAGLASAIAHRIGGTSAQPVPAPTPTRNPIMTVSGSLNTVSARQGNVLTARPDVKRIPMDTRPLLESPQGPDLALDRILSELQATLASGLNPFLTWTGPNPETAASTHRQRSRLLNAALSSLMGPVGAGVSDIGGLVLVGGDTTQAVLTGFGAHGISMRSEVMPGISAGTVVGGDANTTPVIAKAGGFGDDDALIRAMEHLRGEP